MRADAEKFRRIPLRVHGFLHDVPLHDVWVVSLRGGGTGRSIADVLELLERRETLRAGPVVTALFGVRAALGRLLRWDRPAATAPRSFCDRLGEDDRARTLDPPGSRRGFWTVLYRFENEALGEVINRTVHAFLHFSLLGDGEDYRLYWAIYVRPVGRGTALYMRLIDPFRRRLVYPAILRRIEAEWEARWAAGRQSA